MGLFEQMSKFVIPKIESIPKSALHHLVLSDLNYYQGVSLKAVKNERQKEKIKLGREMGEMAGGNTFARIFLII